MSYGSSPDVRGSSDEVACRLEATQSILTWALAGEVPVEAALGGAVKLVCEAQRHLQVREFEAAAR